MPKTTERHSFDQVSCLDVFPLTFLRLHLFAVILSLYLVFRLHRVF